MRHKIGSRLIGGFLICTAITILVGLIAIYALGKTNASANLLLNVEVSEMTLNDQLTMNLAAARRYEKEFFLFSEMGNTAKQNEYSAKLDNSWETISRDARKYQDLPEQSEAKEHAAELSRLINQSRQFLTVVNGLILAGKSYQEVQLEYQQYKTAVHELEDTMADMSQHTRALLQERQEDLLETQSTLRNLVIATVAASVILALVLGSILTRSITQPLRRLSAVVREITAGDLSRRARVSNRDEIGELALSFNQMTEYLQGSRDMITEKNRELTTLNSELSRSNEELAATNQALTETQAKLVRSEKLAAIGQLAGGVGHELRNPLGSIKNAIYYVKGKLTNNQPAQPESRVIEFLDIMDDEINSANKIITDLLDFSRTGKPAVSPTRIETVIKDTLSHLSIPENIRLVKELANGIPEINVDSDQIRRVLFNILSNAIQAMPDGGKLTISAGRKDESLEIKISDTGDGITEELKTKIFDPLFTTKAKGIGLGLALCQSIIERHEGDIEVSSEAGKGATFTIRLPVVERAPLATTEALHGEG